jgi:hypothetical protein
MQSVTGDASDVSADPESSREDGADASAGAQPSSGRVTRSHGRTKRTAKLRGTRDGFVGF